jgi:hypothetical protein
MKQHQKPVTRKVFPWLFALAGLAVLGIVFTVGGFAFAASQEAHDSFCASCHTQPESTFYQNSTAPAPVDLASYHTGQSTRCIDCHSGQGVLGRVSAEVMGARNAVKWYTGTAVQPAVLSFAIGDQNCLKCHQAVTQRRFSPKEQITVPGEGFGGEGGGGEREGRNGHWHQFMARWQAADPAAGTCVTCHSGHQTGSTVQAGFMDAQNVRSTCDACHKVLRKGED